MGAKTGECHQDFDALVLGCVNVKALQGLTTGWENKQQLDEKLHQEVSANESSPNLCQFVPSLAQT